MKKLLYATLLVCISACCSDQEEKNNNLNCDCDRVVEVNTINIIGNPQNPAISYYSVYTTINDCTQVQIEKNYTNTDQSLIPQINKCR